MTLVTTSTRAALLREIKRRGSASQGELAKALGVTREAVRQHLAALEEQGVIEHDAVPAAGPGRPTQGYRVTPSGEHQFPKFYDTLSLSLIEILAGRNDGEALNSVLAEMTDRQVAAWQTRMKGKPLMARIKELRDIYFDDDPYTHVERDNDGAMLIEHNCPYLAVASQEPRICSITVSSLQRLLGVEVERTERFQRGDGRCVFRIHESRPTKSNFRFRLED